MNIVYLVGEPGVGKSTLVDTLTAGLPRITLSDPPHRELILHGGRTVAVELGGRAGRHPAGYPGTDALPMNAVVATERWLLSHRALHEAPLILGEGARLGVRRFAEAAYRAGWRLHVVHLVDPAGAAARRMARGSQQSPSWIRGAATRAARFHAHVAELAAQQPAAFTASETAPADALAHLRGLTGIGMEEARHG